MTIKTSGSQKESQVIELNKKPPVILHYDLEYDTTCPQGVIQAFVARIREMLGRFESNKARIFEIEAEINDVEHYMEIGNFKNVPEGYRLYRKLAELRRERRACKNENDLLVPIWEHFHATEVLNKLTMVQGECSKLREMIDGRTYTVRTDVLNEWLEPENGMGNQLNAPQTKDRDILPIEDCPEDFVGVNLLTGETAPIEPKYTLAWSEKQVSAL